MDPETIEEMLARMKREMRVAADKIAAELARMNAARQEEELEDFNVSDTWTD